MNLDNYEQYTISANDLEHEKDYLTEGLEGIVAILLDALVIAIELPTAVSMIVTDTSPGIKGSTASSRTKPATLNTGVEIQVPEYIENGETLKINTVTGKYMSRAQ